MSIRRVLLVAFALVVIMPGYAHAVTYACLGQAYIGTAKTVGYGTRAQLYVYPKQSPQDNDWVNSIYAGNMYGAFYEAGWFWSPAATTQPQFFTHLFNGYTHQERWLSATLTPGTRHTFAVQNNGVDFTYRAYLDGALKDTWTDTTIRSCYPCVGAERYTLSDYNKGQFLYAAYLKLIAPGAYAWYYWTDGRVNIDSDPDSDVYFNYLDRSDHYVYVDDHQN